MQTNKSTGTPGPRTNMGRELSALVWPFRNLGQQVGGSGEQVVSSSLLPGAVKDGENRRSQQINTWL